MEDASVVGAGRALARVGLLGNPSDGYGGRVIAMTVPDFGAHVTLAASDDWNFADSELLAAAVSALRDRQPTLVEEPARFEFTTTIPRQVGLSGSSAIIIAALRALAGRSDFAWNPVDLARTALEVETHVLGWAAGPQDRVVQAYEGLVDMDFSEPWQPTRYQRLGFGRLPSLFVAWNQSLGEPSTVAHSNVRTRWLAGESLVVETMTQFAELARQGRIALDEDRAPQRWPSLMTRAFELRRAIWDITDVDNSLVETGSRLGAGVAFAGSGGAVVGSVTDAADLVPVARAYDQMGAGFLVINP